MDLSLITNVGYQVCMHKFEGCRGDVFKEQSFNKKVIVAIF